MPIVRTDIRSSFIDLFTRELGLTQDEFAVLLEKFHRTRIPKRSYYLRAGDVSTHKAYVNKGCARSYVLDNKGKEHVLFFGFEDWWLADYESQATGRPAKLYIQALEDLELVSISTRDFAALEQDIPALRNWFVVKQQKMVFGMIDRLIEVKTCSPEERLAKLVRNRPDIFQRAAMYDIASYLDIEPPSLSRMRKRLLEAQRTS